MNTLKILKDGRLRAGLSAAALLLAFALAGCGKSGTKDEHAGEKKEGHNEAESELTLTTAGRRLRDNGLRWWTELSLLQRFGVIVFG